MMTFDARQVQGGLPWDGLVDALRAVFAEGCEQPLRSRFHIGGSEGGDLLLMPAWQNDRYVGVKLVTVFRGNAALKLPAVSSVYMLFDARTGVPLAQLDGEILTARRTAAASVLAAKYLARPDSKTLAIMGTGKVSRNLADAYCACFGIDTVMICSSRLERAEAMVEEMRGLAPNVVAIPSVARAMEHADIVSCATISAEPLIRAEHLKPGQHVDLVGAYRPDMRESEDAVMSAADGIFVDTREGAFREAGDIIQAIASGAISEASVSADLAELCKGYHPGRRQANEITVFKSVGASCEDLAAAQLVLRSAEASGRKTTGAKQRAAE